VHIFFLIRKKKVSDMTEEKVENLVGALSLALADNLLHAAQSNVPLSAPAAAITIISQAPGITIDQFSHALGLSHPGGVRLVDRLVGEDLVKRGRSATDGRAVALSLTERGEEMCTRILISRQNALSRESLGRIVETMLRGILRSGEHAFEVCRLCNHDVCVECPVEHEIISRQENA
jgi:MarR family transcriptional regulator, negative regulator of the multidrug operon emrRAB